MSHVTKETAQTLFVDKVPSSSADNAITGVACITSLEKTSFS